jgi:hypothetical protein
MLIHVKTDTEKVIRCVCVCVCVATRLRGGLIRKNGKNKDCYTVEESIMTKDCVLKNKYCMLVVENRNF